MCHLILAKINCITLKIRSKADFNSKLQNIWQQIILFSSTVMQMIWAWNKIWTLRGEYLSCAMFTWWNKTILCVPNKNNCQQKIGLHNMKQTDSSIINVRNVCVLTSAYMIVYLFFTRSWSAIIRQNFSSRGYDRQSTEKNNRKLISLHNNGEVDKHAYGFSDF
jgi:hypothetical protein